MRDSANQARDRGTQDSGGQRSAPPRQSSPPRAEAATPRQAPSGDRSGGYRGSNAYRGPNVYRGSPQNNVYASRGYGIGSQRGVVVGRSVGRFNSRVVIAPRRFYQPYYSFRPRVSLGFGLWVGYPISYPYSYGYYDPFYSPYGYGYPDPYSYGNPYPAQAYPYPSSGYPSYPANGSPYPSTGYPSDPGPAYPQYPTGSGSVGVQPGSGQQNMGGVSFDITPVTAEVFIDGTFAGTVGQFTSTSQPLGLAQGQHRIEIRAAGYRTIDFDANIVPGQVIPYQGTMER